MSAICSCHPEPLEEKFATAMEALAESGCGLTIKQELIARNALGLQAPHEVSPTSAVELDGADGCI